MLLLLVIIVSSSCSQEESNKPTEQIITNLEFNQKLTHIEQQGETTGKMVFFTYNILESGKYNIIKEGELNKKLSWETGFAIGFSKNKNTNFSKKSKTVEVACFSSEGTLISNTSCGSGDGGCLGSAIKSCLDKGGCAVVCSEAVMIAYLPNEDLFLVGKESSIDSLLTPTN